MQQDESGWVDDDMDAAEALDREFGLDPRAIPARSRAQVRRLIVLVAAITVAAAAVVAGTLSVTVRSVQNGIGGMFPQPTAVLHRFEADADALAGVVSAKDLRVTQIRIFTGYEVTALVTAQRTLTDAEQAGLVGRLSDAARARSDDAVRVFAEVTFGDLRVAVSPERAITTTRLLVGEQLAAMGGVDAVRCTWSSSGDGPVDDVARSQSVTVTAAVPDDRFAQVQSDVVTTVHAKFPAAAVRVLRGS